MTFYEIINPSDATIVSAKDPIVAAIAILLLGNGKYGARSEDDGMDVLPILAFQGPAVLKDWLKSKGIEDLPTWIDAHRHELADVFDSIFYGSASEYAALDKALAGLPDVTTRRAKYNDRRRTSMNNIGAQCQEMAAHLRGEVTP